MIDKWWQKIPEKFPGIELDEYQVMPNHLHAVLINVGADPGVRPVSSGADNAENNTQITVDNIGLNPGFHPASSSADNVGDIFNDNPLALPMGLGAHIGSPISDIIRWFKTMATNEYIRNVKMNNWKPFNGKLFQRDYYEHIIRNEEAYNNIVAYIRNNPANWDKDNFYLG